ncbi:hypothetical protein [Clostridium baratii]|uniref:hypothetical protein n=1 Tax=Clostridium baratii TaxID=1561 RepID=UPI0030CB5555
MRKVNKIADLIMYSGPNLEELILNASNNGKNITINNLDKGILEVIIEDTVVYDVKVIDSYFYDIDKKLIKHSIILNNKETVIFDKNKEIIKLLRVENNIEVA